MHISVQVIHTIRNYWNASSVFHFIAEKQLFDTYERITISLHSTTHDHETYKYIFAFFMFLYTNWYFHLLSQVWHDIRSLNLIKSQFFNKIPVSKTTSARTEERVNRHKTVIPAIVPQDTKVVIARTKKVIFYNHCFVHYYFIDYLNQKDNWPWDL